MRLNKKLEIGINAIGALKKRNGFVRTKDIAIEIGTTVSFLEQIMRNLLTSGIVKVKRGPGGGYSLNKESEITALSVARAVGTFKDIAHEDNGSMALELCKNVVEAYRSTKL